MLGRNSKLTIGRKKNMLGRNSRVTTALTWLAIAMALTLLAVLTALEASAKPDGMHLQMQARAKPVYACQTPFEDTIVVEMRPQSLVNAAPFLQAGFSCSNRFGDFMWCNATRLAKPLDVAVFSDASVPPPAVFFSSLSLSVGCMYNNRPQSSSTCVAWVGGSSPFVYTGRTTSSDGGCQNLVAHYVAERVWRDHKEVPSLNYDWTLVQLAPQP